MKKQTKAQKFNDLANAIGQIRRGEPVRRVGCKDGSIQTHPVVPVYPYSESVVLKACLAWLRKHGILCNRNNVGAGQMGISGYYSYGIRGAGDIVGLLKTGQHFEIETKSSGGGRLSVNQQKRMRDIRENGGLFFVVHGIEELEYYLGEYV